MNVTAYTDTELAAHLTALAEGDYFPHSTRNVIRDLRNGADRNGYKTHYTDAELRSVIHRHFIFN